MASPISIARWLRQEAGIDDGTFKAHSVRGAACSTATWSGVTISDILQIGPMKVLSSNSTIKKHRKNNIWGDSPVID